MEWQSRRKKRSRGQPLKPLTDTLITLVLNNSACRAMKYSELKPSSLRNLSKTISRNTKPTPILASSKGFAGTSSQHLKNAITMYQNTTLKVLLPLLVKRLSNQKEMIQAQCLEMVRLENWIGTFEGHKGVVWSCCLDRSALHAASGFANFTVKIWDALTGYESHSSEHKHIVRACAFSEDTQLLLTGGTEKILRIFDLNRPEAPPREVDTSPGSVRSVAWLHSNQTILSCFTDIGGVRLWDVRSGKIVQILQTKLPVTSAEVSRDSRYITTADGSTVKFWDANHFGLVKSYNRPCTVESASLEPKYGNNTAGGKDMWVRLFDFHTGEEITCHKGHRGPVHCVRFSSGGESYALGSEDGTVRIWQTGPTTLDENVPAANGPTGKVKVTVNEVAHKIEGFNISEDGQADGKKDASNEP